MGLSTFVLQKMNDTRMITSMAGRLKNHLESMPKSSAWTDVCLDALAAARDGEETCQP